VSGPRDAPNAGRFGDPCEKGLRRHQPARGQGIGDPESHVWWEPSQGVEGGAHWTGRGDARELTDLLSKGRRVAPHAGPPEGLPPGLDDALDDRWSRSLLRHAAVDAPQPGRREATDDGPGGKAEPQARRAGREIVRYAGIEVDAPDDLPDGAGVHQGRHLALAEPLTFGCGAVEGLPAHDQGVEHPASFWGAGAEGTLPFAALWTTRS
jgi:hypothetical protein